MFCSTCGVSVAQGLSYCNYCGAKLSGAEEAPDSPDVKPGLLVSAMVGLFILGLVAITMLMGVMKQVLDLPGDRVIAFAFFPFLMMVVLEAVLLRLLFRRKRETRVDVDKSLSKGQATKELDAANARALPEGVPSVTEHTTRAFAPIHKERTPK